MDLNDEMNSSPEDSTLKKLGIMCHQKDFNGNKAVCLIKQVDVNQELHSVILSFFKK